VYNGWLVVFGGIYEITKELNDCYIFNLKTKVWKRLFTTTNDFKIKGSHSPD
jgi:hypothetical protein